MIPQLPTDLPLDLTQQQLCYNFILPIYNTPPPPPPPLEQKHNTPCIQTLHMHPNTSYTIRSDQILLFPF